MIYWTKGLIHSWRPQKALIFRHPTLSVHQCPHSDWPLSQICTANIWIPTFFSCFYRVFFKSFLNHMTSGRLFKIYEDLAKLYQWLLWLLLPKQFLVKMVESIFHGWIYALGNTIIDKHWLKYVITDYEDWKWKKIPNLNTILKKSPTE